MERVLAIVSDENDYAAGLADYCRLKTGFMFYPVSFSNVGDYLSYEENNHVDMLLCDERLIEEYRTFRAENICVLSELAYVKKQGEYPEVFKYQSSEAVLKEVESIYGNRQQSAKSEPVLSNLGNSRLIAVCSPIGGSYKSTFSLALAQYYSCNGKTLFLSLDPFFVLPSEIKNTTDKNMSDVLYYLECYGQEPMGLIDKISRQYGNLDYIAGVSHWVDVCNIKREHMQSLLSAIKRSNYYQNIIIDTWMIGEASIDLLTAAEIIYAPVGQERNSIKLDEWKRQLDFIGLNIVKSKVREITIPFDELLAGYFTIEQLLKGRTGRFIEELEGKHYIR